MTDHQRERLVIVISHMRDENDYVSTTAIISIVEKEVKAKLAEILDEIEKTPDQGMVWKINQIRTREGLTKGK